MRKIHIGYVEAGYPHPHGGGGAGTYVRLMAKELVSRGIQVTVVASWCPRCPAFLEDEGIAVYRPRSRGNIHWYASKLPGLRGLSLSIRYLEQGWRWYRLLEDLHRQQPFTVVEFAEGGDFWHAYRPSFPFIAHLHGSRYTFLHETGRSCGLPDLLNRKLEHIFIRRAHRVFSPSRSSVQIVRQEMDGRALPEVVMPYPLDPVLLGDEDGESVRHEKNGRMIFYAARNDRVKGASVLLDAAPLVRRRVPDARFVLVGHEMEAGKTCPDGVRCFPFMPREELQKYYKDATLCVFPSYFETFCYTVCEAMCAGRAVVATRVGAIPELLADGETGLLVPPGDAVKLADAISGLLLDPQRCREMGLAGRQRIKSLTDLAQNVSKRLAIYKEIEASLLA